MAEIQVNGTGDAPGAVLKAPTQAVAAPRRWRPRGGPGTSGAPLARTRAWLRRRWLDHWLITSTVALSLVPRALASLGFRPALLTPDSFGYLASGTHPGPAQWHPAGYPVFLFLLEPFHSLMLVTIAQHLLGVAAAVLCYAVLRQWGVPAWGATLAASPTLFDARQVALESFILPDALYALLLTGAVALLATRGRRTPRRCAVAGALLAWAALTRGNGAPELAAVLAVLALQRAGWRQVAAATVAFAVPVLGYMGLFAAHYGDFALTNSDGMFLWSRTMSFADCAVIQPPASLRPLCPDAQPGHPTRATAPWSARALLYGRTPADYLWAPAAWWRHDATPGFNAANNARARAFAMAAEPGAYLRTVSSGVLLTFLATDRQQGPRALQFTPVPQLTRLDQPQRLHLASYGHTTTGEHQVQPWAFFVYLYQQPVYLPGAILGLAVLTGLAGVARNWRRWGGPGALPWAVAAVGVVFPVAVHEYHYRYVVSVIPVTCLAAGLAFARRPVSAPAEAAHAAPPRPSGPPPSLAEAIPAQAPPTS